MSDQPTLKVGTVHRIAHRVRGGNTWTYIDLGVDEMPIEISDMSRDLFLTEQGDRVAFDLYPGSHEGAVGMNFRNVTLEERRQNYRELRESLVKAQQG